MWIQGSDPKSDTALQARAEELGWLALGMETTCSIKPLHSLHTEFTASGIENQYSQH